MINYASRTRREAATRPRARALAPLLLVLWLAAPIEAGAVAGRFEDPALQERYSELTQQLRCLVCQGQSIAESDSGFANDIKREIRQKMEQGATDEEIVEFLVQRYGDFILFRPPLKPATALLWIGPALLLLTGATVLGAVLRRRRKDSETPLTDEEIKRAESLLAAGGDKEDGKV